MEGETWLTGEAAQRQWQSVFLSVVALWLIAACSLSPSSPTTTAPDESSGSQQNPSLSSTSSVSDSEFAAFEPGPLAARMEGTLVWTGTEVIVWGGCGDDSCRSSFADGAAYDPRTDSWRIIADVEGPERSHHLAAWTGTEMLIVGGRQSTVAGAAYSPSKDSWHRIADAPFPIVRTSPDGGGNDIVSGVWTGDHFVVWDARSDQVAGFSPTANEWIEYPSTGFEVDRGVLRWSGDTVYALGALTSAHPADVVLHVARYRNGSWEVLAPGVFRDDNDNVFALPRLGAWVGDRLVVISESGAEHGTNWELSPRTGLWTEIGRIPMEAGPGWEEPLVIGDRLLVFGGAIAGAIYDPSQGVWVEADVPFGEAGRAVWTGREVIFWGNVCCYGAGTPLEMASWRWTPPD